MFNRWSAKCCRHLPRTSREQFCTPNLACRTLLLSGCHGFWRLIKSTPGWSCRRRTWHFSKQIQPVFLNVSSPKTSVGSTTSSQRPNDHPCSRNTPLLPLQRRPRWCRWQGRWWPPSSGIQRALCSLTTFRKANFVLFRKGIVCQLAEAAPKGNKVKMAWKTDVRSPVSPGQCSCTQDCGCAGWCALLWLVDHPPYSPDLAPSNYFLFLNIKKHLAVKRYRPNDEVISAVDFFFFFFFFFWESGWELLTPQESKRCNTDGRSVWTTGEIM